MRTLTAIVVGTDFSPAAEIALRSAAHLSRRYAAKIHLGTVVLPPTVYRRVRTPLDAGPTIEQLVGVAREQVAQLARSPVLAGLNVSTTVRVGTPFAELIAVCREQQASLIAVGTRPRRRLEHLLLGNTTERIVRKAPVPVLVARAELAAEPICVLAPVDFSPAGRSAAEEAVALARRWIARLIFLHVIEPIAQAHLWPLDSGTAEIFPAEPTDLRAEWEEFLAPLGLHDVRWEQRTLKGDAAALITQTSEDEAADLIVMGTHGRSGLAHTLLGSLVERVLRSATKPVLTIRPEAFQFTLP